LGPEISLLVAGSPANVNGTV